MSAFRRRIISSNYNKKSYYTIYYNVEGAKIFFDDVDTGHTIINGKAVITIDSYEAKDYYTVTFKEGYLPQESISYELYPNRSTPIIVDSNSGQIQFSVSSKQRIEQFGHSTGSVYKNKELRLTYNRTTFYEDIPITAYSEDNSWNSVYVDGFNIIVSYAQYTASSGYRQTKLVISQMLPNGKNISIDFVQQV